MNMWKPPFFVFRFYAFYGRFFAELETKIIFFKSHVTAFPAISSFPVDLDQK